MSLLSINLNLLAALRDMRRAGEPDPAQAAVVAELAGADGIDVQVRRDRRFIRDRDLYLLNAMTKTKLTVEMPPAEDLVERMIEVKPPLVIFVADHIDLESPAGTIDFGSPEVDFRDLTERFKAVDVQVGYYVEPENGAIKGASKTGASTVLLNCSGYTGARTPDEAQAELDRLDSAGRYAAKAGLTVLLGRGIGYRNIGPLAELGYVEEFVVGHAIISRAMLVGLQEAVREMKTLLRVAVRPQ